MLAAKYQVSIHRILKHVGLSSSSYYFQATGGRKGRLPSKITYHEKHGDIGGYFGDTDPSYRFMVRRTR